MPAQRFSSIRRLVGVMLVGAAMLAGGRTEARSRVVMLAFGGRNGDVARTILLRSIRRQFQVLSGEKLIAACDTLGIPFSKGANLARAARHIGAVAVIGGKASRRRLSLAVFSGASGRPIATAALPWRSRPRGAEIRRASALLVRSIRKAQRSAPRRARSTKPDGGDMTFAPEPIGRSNEVEDTEDPTATGGASAGSSGGDSETPSNLQFKADEPKLEYSPSGSAGAAPTEVPQGEQANLSFQPQPMGEQFRGEVAKESSGDDAEGKPATIEGRVGIGIWARNFTLSDAAPGQAHSEYSSGAAFALQVALRGRPLVPLVEKGPLTNIYAQLQLQTTIGLSSQPTGGATEALGTSIFEFVFDFGYRWTVLDDPGSPAIDFGMGFGSLSFGVDWAGATPQLADVGYTFMLFGVGVDYPFLLHLGGRQVKRSLARTLALEAGFNYRLAFSSGDVGTDAWYGDASQGGLAANFGLRWTYGGFVTRFDWTYTRYFLSFDAGAYETRRTNGKLAAGGALDQYHALILGVGYGF